MLSSPSKVFSAFALSLFWLIASPVFASENASRHAQAELSLTDSQGTEVSSGVLASTQAKMQVTGLINHVTITQEYKNTHPFSVNARYVFPLPSESAVYAMTMQVDERIIQGKIAEKQQAQRIFNQAKKAGKRAALVKQQRANMFVSKLANLGAGQTLKITLKYQEMVQFNNGEFAIRLPTTFTPRYHPVKVSIGENEPFTGSATQQIIPNGWIAPKLIATKQQSNEAIDEPPSFSLTMDIDFGLELKDIRTPSWQSEITNPSFGKYQVTVSSNNANRDFVFSARPEQSENSQAAFFRQTASTGDYGLLMLLPPKQQVVEQKRIPRELIFIVDSSGSMEGQSMEAARKALFYALDKLHEQDKFNIIDFDSQTRLFQPTAVFASRANRREATRFVYNLQADGGTEMAGALQSALAEQGADGFVRQVIFLTDGSVSNEQQLFDYIKQNLGDNRLFTVGLGSAPNGYFMRRAANVGRGSFTFIAHAQQVDEKMQTLLTKLQHPALSKVSLGAQNQEKLAYFPNPLPDLYFDQPLMVAIKLPQQDTQITVRGQNQHQDVQFDVPAHLAERDYPKSEAIARLWARQQIASLLLYNEKSEVKDQVLTLALQHQLISPFTAFVAVDESKTVPPATRSAQVPNAVAQGQKMLQFAQTDGQSRLHFLLALVLLLAGSLVLFRGKPHG